MGEGEAVIAHALCSETQIARLDYETRLLRQRIDGGTANQVVKSGSCQVFSVYDVASHGCYVVGIPTTARLKGVAVAGDEEHGQLLPTSRAYPFRGLRLRGLKVEAGPIAGFHSKILDSRR